MGKTTKGTKGTAAPTTTTEATFVKPVPVAPTNRKGTSKVANPVGVTWVTCLNLTHTAGAVQGRAAYTRAVVAAGVTYYTARTQVNRYLGWVAGGCVGPLPRGVTVPEGMYLGNA